jgi:hypothetical protein
MFHKVVGFQGVFSSNNVTAPMMAAKGRLLDRQSLSLVQPKRRFPLDGMSRPRK